MKFENIRKFESKDLDRIMEVWLNTNIEAHDFIDEKYWRGNFDMVKEMMPSAELYVFEENSEIKGFVGVMDNYIAGIFVDGNNKSRGIGKKLLDFVKNKKDSLELSVYEKNTRAMNFYKREGFEIGEKNIDENTDEVEIKMIWTK